uniref:Uncharacterized protein n=1 Tax=Arundo donax TaxID=35708 RepID=A0A0A9AV85_ARUDO
MGHFRTIVPVVVAIQLTIFLR